jgi:hypothetical protein
MFISIYMITAARILYVQFLTVLLLSLCAALVLALTIDPFKFDDAHGFVSYAFRDAINSERGSGIAVAGIIVAFSAGLIAVATKTAKRLWSDRPFFGTPVAAKVQGGMPKVYIAALLSSALVYPLYLAGLIQQNFFPGTGLFGYLATFFIHSCILFLIVGDLYLTTVLKSQRTKVGDNTHDN